MSVKAMETFLHFTDCLSFSETARRMDCTQPAAFAHISLLQEDLGLPLYWRDGSGLRLTPIGTQLATFLRLYRERASGLAADMLADITPAPFSLAASADITLYLLAPQLARLGLGDAERHLKLRAYESPYASQHVREGRTQLALVDCLDAATDLRSTLIKSWPYVLCGPRASHLGKGDKDSLEDLSRLPLITAPPQMKVRQLLETYYRQRGTKPRVNIEVPVYELMLKFVDLGLGYTVVPAYCVDDRPHVPLIDLPPCSLYMIERWGNIDGSRLDVFKRSLLQSL